MSINIASICLVIGLVIILIAQGLMGGPEIAFTHMLEHLWDDVVEWKVHVLIFGVILVIYGAIRRLITTKH